MVNQDPTALPMPAGTNPPFPSNPVYAQPLYVAGLTIGTGTYNVLYIAALNGEVYAYKADRASSGATSTCDSGGAGTSGCIWVRDETNVSGMQGLKHDCDVLPNYGSSVDGIAIPNYLQFAGVISTPVIEPKGADAALYVTNLCVDPSGNAHWYLNALNIKTGANLGTPTEIVFSAIGTNGPQQAFFPASQFQRGGLLLVSSSNTSVCSSPPCRSVIASFGTAVNETTTQYQGWMFAYNGNGPSTLDTYARGPAANTLGHVFAVSGSGGFNYCPTCTQQCIPSGRPMSGYTDVGEAMLKIQMTGVWNYSGSGTVPFWPDDFFALFRNGSARPDEGALRGATTRCQGAVEG
jgi:hypothetical protein